MPKTYYKVQFVFSGDFRAILLSGRDPVSGLLTD